MNVYLPPLRVSIEYYKSSLFIFFEFSYKYIHARIPPRSDLDFSPPIPYQSNPGLSMNEKNGMEESDCKETFENKRRTGSE